jgi:hypothetical protein
MPGPFKMCLACWSILLQVNQPVNLYMYNNLRRDRAEILFSLPTATIWHQSAWNAHATCKLTIVQCKLYIRPHHEANVHYPPGNLHAHQGTHHVAQQALFSCKVLLRFVFRVSYCPEGQDLQHHSPSTMLHASSIADCVHQGR